MKKFKKSLVIYCAGVLVVMAILILGVWLFADKLLKNDIEQSGVCIVEAPEDYANKDFSDKIVDGVLKLEVCGAEPDSNYDYGDLIRSAISTCIQNNAVLELEKDAVYYCSPAEDNPDFLFDCSGEVVSTFTMRGNGATIMNCDNYSGLFRFVDGAVVDISGMVYDYVVVPWAQGEIVAIDEESQTMTLLMDDDYTILDDERFADNKETEFGMFRNGENPKLIDDDSLHYFRFNNIRKIEDRGYEVTIWNHYRELGNTVDIGDKIIINNRRDSGYSVFDVRTCGDVKLEDITVYAANGCIVLGHHNVGDITLENVDVTYKPDSNRWITTNSDGIHIWGCTGKVSLNNCTFEGLSDDGMNLYQGGAVVTEQISETEFIVSGENANSYAPQQKGEEIIFFKADDGSTQGEATVVASEVVENKNYQLVRKITVDTPIKGVVTGNLNLEVPTTLEQLYSVLTAFRDDDPNGNGQQDEIPLAMAGIPDAYFGNWGLSFSYNSGYLAVNDEGQVQYGYAAEGTKKGLTYLNRLTTQGLAEMTDNDNKFQSKVRSGVVGVFYGLDKYVVAGDDVGKEYTMIAPLSAEDGSTPVMSVSNSVTPNAVFITKKCENPETAMKFIDYLYSTEGSILVNYGADGQKVAKNDDGKYEWVEENADVDAYTYAPGHALPSLLDDKLNDAFLDIPDDQKILREKQDDELELEVKNVLAGKHEPKNEIGVMMLDKQAAEIEEKYYDAIKEYAIEMINKFANGEVNVETGWEGYMEEINKKGLSELLAEYQRIYDAKQK